jgi:CRP/FNR family cyclic AMP-dependent transcriptional regulator
MPTDAALLANLPFFQPLDDAERAAIAPTLEEVHFPAGHVIFEIGDPGDALYVIRSGEVEVFIKDDTGTRIVLELDGQDDFFGEISLLHPGPRTATALVTRDVEALRVDRDDLERCLEHHPTMALDLLEVVGARLRDVNTRLRHTASRNVNDQMADTRSTVQRVADWIAEFSGSITFLLINAGLFLIWIVVNTDLVPGVAAFDPFPFGLLTMAVSLEAIFLSIFVLISQNRQAAKDRVRADIEYDVNLKAELEIAQLHEKIDDMNADVLAHVHNLETGLNRRLDAIVVAIGQTRGDLHPHV